MASLERERFGFLTGHFAFSQVAYERVGAGWRSSPSCIGETDWISDYFYNRYKPNNSHGGIDDDIERFLETERATVMGRTYLQIPGRGLGTHGQQRQGQPGDRRPRPIRLVGLREDMDQVSPASSGCSRSNWRSVAESQPNLGFPA